MAALRSASDDELRRLASEILERREFARYDIDEVAWRDFLLRLEDRIAGLVEWLRVLHLESPLLYWVLAAGLALVAFALLAHAAWSIRVALRASAPAVAPAARRARRDLLAEAEVLAASGGFLEAARRVAHACLELLVERGTIRLGRAEPNRVLRGRLARAALPEPERRELVALIDRLETRLFRDHAEEPDLYAAWRDLHQRLDRAAGAA